MNTLILKAATNSQWDSVDFALVGLSEEFCKIIQAAYMEAEKLKKTIGYSFGHIVLGTDDAEWYVNVSDSNSPSDRIMGILGENEWAVAKEEFETITLQGPEQSVRDGEIRVCSAGVQFVGWGKHTAEEFYTTYIPITNFKP